MKPRFSILACLLVTSALCVFFAMLYPPVTCVVVVDLKESYSKGVPNTLQSAVATWRRNSSWRTYESRARVTTDNFLSLEVSGPPFQLSNVRSTAQDLADHLIATYNMVPHFERLAEDTSALLANCPDEHSKDRLASSIATLNSIYDTMAPPVVVSSHIQRNSKFNAR